MEEKNQGKSTWLNWQNSLIILLIFALVASVWWLGKSVHYSYRTGQFSLRLSPARNFSMPRRTLAVNSIQMWMTFDYINHVFKLPPAYLKQSLNISDPRYPNLELSKYARHYTLNSVTFLNSVQLAVKNYQEPK